MKYKIKYALGADIGGSPITATQKSLDLSGLNVTSIGLTLPGSFEYDKF